MSTTTKDRTEAAETTAEDQLPYHPEDWPEEFREYLDRLPDVDQELSDIISEMEGLVALAETSLLIYMNARNIRSGDSEAGKLDYRKARMISPMREETAKFVWQVYRRVDAFYDLLQEYECEAQEGALRLSAALRNGGERTNGGVGDGEPTDGTVTLSEDDVRALNVLVAAVNVVCDGELGGYVGGTPDRTPAGLRRVWKKVWDHMEPTLLKIEDAHPLSGDDMLNERGDTLARLAREAEEEVAS